MPTTDLSVVVIRAFGTVIVTARGKLDRRSCEVLEKLFTELIDDNANLTVAVDLAGVTVEAERPMVFVIAACQARRRATRFIVLEPPASTAQVLRSCELGNLVEILPGAHRWLAPPDITEFSDEIETMHVA